MGAVRRRGVGERDGPWEGVTIERILADVVLALHFAFIAFAALGGLLALRWRAMPWIHLPAVLWGAFIELSGGICPLTPLENALRRAAGAPTYSRSFVEQYIAPLVYPDDLSRSAQLALAALLVLINAIVYAAVLHRKRARRGRFAAEGGARGARVP